MHGFPRIGEKYTSLYESYQKQNRNTKSAPVYNNIFEINL